MAIIKTQAQEIEVKEYEPIVEACIELGVAFGCQSGLCGTCKTEVLEGMENLIQKTQNEIDMEVEGNERLMCQCKIKSGVVKIKVD